MDELVAGAFHAQLRLRITQDNLPPAETQEQIVQSWSGSKEL